MLFFEAQIRQMCNSDMHSAIELLEHALGLTVDTSTARVITFGETLEGASFFPPQITDILKGSEEHFPESLHALLWLTSIPQSNGETTVESLLNAGFEAADITSMLKGIGPNLLSTYGQISEFVTTKISNNQTKLEQLLTILAVEQLTTILKGSGKYLPGNLNSIYTLFLEPQQDGLTGYQQLERRGIPLTTIVESLATHNPTLCAQALENSQNLENQQPFTHLATLAEESKDDDHSNLIKNILLDPGLKKIQTRHPFLFLNTLANKAAEYVRDIYEISPDKEHNEAPIESQSAASSSTPSNRDPEIFPTQDYSSDADIQSFSDHDLSEPTQSSQEMQAKESTLALILNHQPLRDSDIHLSITRRTNSHVGATTQGTKNKRARLDTPEDEGGFRYKTRQRCASESIRK